MNSLSVIIPSRNATNLMACVKAIADNEPQARIIPVLDGPLRDLVKLDDPNVVCGVDPFQFSRNVNIGIRAAGSDDVVICNDDALLQSPKGFSLLQSEHERRNEFAIIGATTNVTGQPKQFLYSGGAGNSGLRQVEHIAFVAVFIPRSTLDREDIGYLDERYVCGYEDRDYCEAVNRAGLLVGVHDGCYVDHGSLVSTVRGPGGPGYDKRGAQTFADKWGYVAK